MWTLQLEMTFYATLVGLLQLGELKRYLLYWESLLATSLCICPTLDAMQSTHGEAAWDPIAMAVRHLMLLDSIPLFAVGFMLYMIKTKTGRQWQNIPGVLVPADIFHTMDHGKLNPLATALTIGFVTASADGRVPLLRFKPLVYVSTISYALYLCHDNLGCALIYRLDQAGVPPQLCF